MILEDFIMLGKTIPEVQLKTGRIMVCSAGYSPELRRLVRLYPLAKGKSPPRWSMSRVALERNPQDSRDESWKLHADRSAAAHAGINKCFEHVCDVKERERKETIMKLAARTPSLKQANEERISLCVIHPESVPTLDFKENSDSPDHPQLALFDRDVTHINEGSKRFAFQPYLQFKDADGWHKLQLRDWGAYEFMRKYGDQRRHELSRALHLDQRPCLLLGNMSHQRTSWLVISVFQPVLVGQQSAFVFGSEPQKEVVA